MRSDMTAPISAATSGMPSKARLWLARNRSTSSGSSRGGGAATGDCSDMDLVANHLQRRRAEAELIEHLRPVFQVAQPGRPLKILRHDDGIAGHDLLAVDRRPKETALPGADHRTIRPKQIDARAVGLLARATGHLEIVGDAAAR